jgi:hypothetical protein
VCIPAAGSHIRPGRSPPSPSTSARRAGRTQMR